MKTILRQIKNKLKGLNQWKPLLSPMANKTRIGTVYGGWVIPDNYLNEESICYLAGAGEDISFDVGVAKKYNCQVYIFDPTPKAKKHFDNLVESTKQNKKMPINSKDYYDCDSNTIKLLNFEEIGIWNKEDEIKFYSPKDPTHVSHSAVNLQKTEKYFTAKVSRLSEIMKANGHQTLDLLKIDIEGAEYLVIDTIIEDKLKIKVICVEYDEANNPLDKNYQTRIKESINKIINYGYKVVDCDLHYNVTFVSNDLYSELTSIKKK
jgi:FkbM family methyltransferase